MSARPTLLLVHGGLHGAWAFDLLGKHLTEAGIKYVAVDLPSCGPDPSTLGGMYDDAAAVRAASDAIEGPVVVLAHSYGGVPVTEGVHGSKNVVHIVFLCSLMIDVGDSLVSLAGGGPPPWCAIDEEKKVVYHTKMAEDIFYSGVDEKIRADAMKRLAYHSCKATSEPLRVNAWKEIPTTYIITEEDPGLPVAMQEVMAQRAGNIMRLKCGHSPFLCHPERVVDALKEVLERVRK